MTITTTTMIKNTTTIGTTIAAILVLDDGSGGQREMIRFKLKEYNKQKTINTLMHTLIEGRWEGEREGGRVVKGEEGRGKERGGRVVRRKRKEIGRGRVVKGEGEW